MQKAVAVNSDPQQQPVCSDCFPPPDFENTADMVGDCELDIGCLSHVKGPSEEADLLRRWQTPI
jgi:hypothetical protein